MIPTLRSIVLVAALSVSFEAVASQEGVLAWGSFRIESPGIGNSGPVVISGSQGPSGLQDLVVEAFGRLVALSTDDLSKLQGITVNAMQLSYEHGYRELGGRTVYITVSMGFTSGTRQKKVLSVNELGHVEVSDFSQE